MKRLLLTGGRAAAALELARLFHAAGWRVVVAESLAWNPSRFSRAVSRCYLTPWPTRDPDGYIDALLHIIRRERIDLLVPTCEEIFYVARGRDRLAPYCTVFTEDLETLRRLHSKWLFVQTAKRHGLPTPPTTLLSSPHDVRHALASSRELVVKPVYSRFAARTLIRPMPTDADRIDADERRPWVAQEYVCGRQVCTYSVAHRGLLTIHCAYAAEFTFGLGAAIVHATLNHPASRAWVEAFVRAERFTGQIAFDFIETADGALYAIECNPRATSGVHLFAGEAGFSRAFLGEAQGVLQPRRGRTSIYGVLLAAHALRSVRSWGQLRRWADPFLRGREVFFRTDDPLPFLGQFAAFAALGRRARQHGVSLVDAATLDIEGNGEV